MSPKPISIQTPDSKVGVIVDLCIYVDAADTIDADTINTSLDVHVGLMGPDANDTVVCVHNSIDGVIGWLMIPLMPMELFLVRV